MFSRGSACSSPTKAYHVRSHPRKEQEDFTRKFAVSVTYLVHKHLPETRKLSELQYR
jgi:hypothetical protein